MLEKRIKKSLLETKEKKEKQLIEEKLIKTRFNMIFDGVKSEKDFKKLTEEKQLKISVKFVQEMSYLTNNGLLNEQDVMNIFKSMFGGAFGSVAQTMAEPFVDKILTSLGLNNALIKNTIISYLTTNPLEVIKSFSDCKLMTKMVSESLIESMVMTLQQNKGYDGFAYNALRNQLGKILKSTEFVSGIESKLGEVICSVIGDAKDNLLAVNEKNKVNSTSST